jgi:hypothetical protein
MEETISKTTVAARQTAAMGRSQKMEKLPPDMDMV